MLNFAVEDATRTLLFRDPVVKKREQEIRREVRKGLMDAKERTRKQQKSK